jgi:hypothetical protein
MLNCDGKYTDTESELFPQGPQTALAVVHIYLYAKSKFQA